MVQSIFEEMGGRYERQGEYILPCLTIPPEKEQPIDLFGRRHLDYLREYRKITYTNLLTSGRLNAYLADIDRQAQERFERLIEGMKQAQGITEQLKAEQKLPFPDAEYDRIIANHVLFYVQNLSRGLRKSKDTF